MSLETINHKGYTIEIMADETPQDPREWSTLGTMVCFHSRYRLGDPVDIDKESFGSWEEVKHYIENYCNGILVRPLYLYDHTLQSIKIGEFNGLPQGHKRFDTMKIGFIYTTEERIKNTYAIDEIEEKHLEKANRTMEQEVETYNQYLIGDVYGFEIYNPDGELVDNCWGFYGKDSVVSRAEDIVDSMYRNAKRKKENRLKSLIRYNVPLNKRLNILREYK